MKTQILYVELKSGYSDNGPAWIGKGYFSKSRQSIYFNGFVFKKDQGISSNYVDIETGDEYWISGVKKNGADRHWAGTGIIQIDESIIGEYLTITEQTSLRKNKYKIVQLNNIPAKNIANEIENQKCESEFDNSIRFKNPSDLTNSELNDLVSYYENLDMNSIHKKARKEYIESLNQLLKIQENRNCKVLK